MTHSIRDFSSIEALIAAVREMKRVVKQGGYAVLIENLPIARNEPQKNHLKPRSIRAKLFKNELGYLSKEKLLDGKSPLHKRVTSLQTNYHR